VACYRVNFSFTLLISVERLGQPQGRSENNEVDMATELEAGPCGVRFHVEGRDFFLLRNVQTGSGAYPVSYSLGTGVISLWVKRQGPFTSHLVPRSKKGTSVLHPPPPICLRGVDTENFTFPVYQFVSCVIMRRATNI
jgi:hypothetical protein